MGVKETFTVGLREVRGVMNSEGAFVVVGAAFAVVGAVGRDWILASIGVTFFGIGVSILVSKRLLHRPDSELEAKK